MPRGDRMHKSLGLFPISGIDSISGYVSGKIPGQFLRLVGTCILLLVGERDVRPSTRQIQDDRPSNPPGTPVTKMVWFFRLIDSLLSRVLPCHAGKHHAASGSSLWNKAPVPSFYRENGAVGSAYVWSGTTKLPNGKSIRKRKSVPYPSAHPGPPSDGDSHTPARRLPVSVPWTGTIYGRFPVPRYPEKQKRPPSAKRPPYFGSGNQNHILISHSKITGQGNRGRGTDNTPVQFRNIQFLERRMARTIRYTNRSAL